jgi:hypothetical protein
LRVEDKLAFLVNEAPLGIQLDSGQAFGEKLGILKLWGDHHLARSVNETVKTIAFDGGESFKMK